MMHVGGYNIMSTLGGTISTLGGGGGNHEYIGGIS